MYKLWAHVLESGRQSTRQQWEMQARQSGAAPYQKGDGNGAPADLLIPFCSWTDFLRSKHTRRRSLHVTTRNLARVQATYARLTRPANPAVRARILVAAALLPVLPFISMGSWSPSPPSSTITGGGGNDNIQYFLIWQQSGTTASALNGVTGAISFGPTINGFGAVWNQCVAAGAALTNPNVSMAVVPVGTQTIPVEVTLNSTHSMTVYGPGYAGRGQSGNHSNSGIVLQASTTLTNNNLAVGNRSVMFDLHGDGVTGVAPLSTRENCQIYGILLDCNGNVDIGFLYRGTGTGNGSFMFGCESIRWRVTAFQAGFTAGLDTGASNDFYLIACSANSPSGRNSVNISSISYSGSTVSVVTSSAHPYAAGDSITITGVTPDAYNGYWIVATAADNTHLTYTLVAGLGLGAGATLGMVTNHLTKASGVISTITYAGSTITITLTGGDPYVTGDEIQVWGVTNTPGGNGSSLDYNGWFRITRTGANVYTVATQSGLGLGNGSALYSNMKLDSVRSCLSVLIGDSHVGPDCNFVPGGVACSAVFDSGGTPVLSFGNDTHYGGGGGTPPLANDILIFSCNQVLLGGQYIDNITVGGVLIQAHPSGMSTVGQGGALRAAHLHGNRLNTNEAVAPITVDNVYGGTSNGIKLEQNIVTGNNPAIPAIVRYQNITPGSSNNTSGHTVYANEAASCNGVYQVWTAGAPPDIPPMQNHLVATATIGVTGADFGNAALTSNFTINTDVNERVVLAGPILSRSCIVGQSWRIQAHGILTTSTASGATVTLRLYIGANGTSADTLICTVVGTTQSATENNAPFAIDGQLTIRAIGPAATCVAFLELRCNTGGGNGAAFTQTDIMPVAVPTVTSWNHDNNAFITLTCQASSTANIVATSRITDCAIAKQW